MPQCYSRFPTASLHFGFHHGQGKRVGREEMWLVNLCPWILSSLPALAAGLSQLSSGLFRGFLLSFSLEVPWCVWLWQPGYQELYLRLLSAPQLHETPIPGKHLCNSCTKNLRVQTYLMAVMFFNSAPKQSICLFLGLWIFPGRSHTPSSKAVLAFSGISRALFTSVCRTGEIFSIWNLHGGFLSWLEMEKGPHASPLARGKAKSLIKKSLFCDVPFLIILYSQSRSKGSRILDPVILWKIVFWSGNFWWNFTCHRRISASVSDHILTLSSTSSDVKHQALLWETFIP